jgi:signal transduction histidine kinase
MNSVKVYANLAIMEKQADKYLPMIKEGSQEAITGIRDIIWVLDDKKNSLEQLLSRISLFASPLCEANHIYYKQELSDQARDHKLGQEERRNLYMMLKEAVNNAIKYSYGHTITIEVSVKKGNPVIQIKDDGKGFETSKTNDGNGLKNMQRRAKEIKYDFRIESSPGNGATIHFEKI